MDGDSISVSSGTYYENINFFGKNIKVVGEDQNTTVIDGAMDDIDPVGIINGGFEFYDSADNEWQLIPRNWNTWESGSASSTECCYHIALNGENIFNVSVNGISGVITIPPGFYVGSTLAEALESKINQIMYA